MAIPSGRRASALTRPDFSFERQLLATGELVVAGIDEAGRGPMAGPVTAAAVILHESYRDVPLDDSKRLCAEEREAFFLRLTGDVSVEWACVIVEVEEIDRLNILRASHEAMRRAVLALARRPTHVLIDGLPVRPFPIPQTSLVKGDSRSLSIAAASIIAKVTRDRWMVEADGKYPEYGFARHKGYATPEHFAKLFAHGPCPIHRRSFEPVAQTYLRLG
jgi:ribonuclease HII